MNKLVHRAEKEIDKARILTYVSLLGIIMPVVGLILAFLAASHLSKIEPSELPNDLQEDHDSVLSLTYISRGISVIMLIIWVVSIVALVTEMNKQNEQSQQIIDQAIEESERLQREYDSLRRYY